MSEDRRNAWTPTVSHESRPSEASTSVGAAGAGHPALDHRIGRFVVLGPLGEGGMGRLVVAYDEQLERKVAVKLLRSASPSRVAGLRLLREAQALARLSHPNVVQVHEAGTHAGAVYVAMELIEGVTLRRWAQERSHDWQARLDVLIQAGRGLEAAHASELVHRDFKPDNVLVGQDGRARVVDFGLARGLVDAAAMLEDELLETEETLGAREHSLDAKPPSSEQGAAVLDAALTIRGTVLGTPMYMAPEQHAGLDCDARADQYGFCVTGFELLVGQRPFEDGPTHALARRKQAGLVVEVPPDTPLPPAVVEALRRGLSPDPEARWPDMSALLELLESARAPSRPWLRPALAGAFLLTALGLGSAAAFIHDAPAPCQIDTRAIGASWDAGSRIQARFMASSVPQAAESLAVIEGALGSWTKAWHEAQRESCEATTVHGSQSAQLLDRRAACFARQGAQVEALAHMLSEADDELVARASLISSELPKLGDCSVIALADTSNKANPKPNPDPNAAAVDALYGELTRARAQLRVGRASEARARAERTRLAGQQLENEALVLEAQAVIATVLTAGGELEEGLARLREATLEAERARLPELAASLRVQLARAAAGDAANPEMERWFVDEAQLALDRIDRPDDPRAVELQVARARLAEQAGDYPAAIAAHERAYALAEGRLDEHERALLRMGVGTALYQAGELEAARAELSAVLLRASEAWGAWAPQVARLEFDLGMVVTDLGEPELARAHLERAVAIDTLVWGPASIELARDHFALAYLDIESGAKQRGCRTIEQLMPVYEAELGRAHDETAALITAVGACRYIAGDFAGALDRYELALSIQRELLGEGHIDLGLVYFNIGDARLALGQPEASLAAHERALELFSVLPPEHPALALPLKGRALAWLALGELPRARTELQRALELADPEDRGELAEIRLGLARASLALGAAGVRAQARGLGERALQDFQAAGLTRQAEEARAWLDTLP